MKYAIVIMDGAADEPIAALQNKTCFQAAKIPHCDTVSQSGRLGLVRTIPSGFPPGSDVAQMSILGYAPAEFYSGRAPLEAAAQGIQTSFKDWIFRCNLVTVADGVMQDYSAGHIDSLQARQLIETINEKLGTDQITFYPGISYRHLMVHKGGPFEGELTPPHDILDQPIKDHLPKGKNSKELIKLMEAAADILADHEINKIRTDLGENPATNIWLWGQGHKPQMDNFRKKYQVQGSVITAVDVLRGLARLVGLKTIEVEGATGYLDTNFAGKGQAAIKALEDGDDFVIVHIEAPDEAGHGALLEGKVKSIEDIDNHIVGPLHQYLQKQDAWRLMILPDHPTPIHLRTHIETPVPFAIAGTNISPTQALPYDESSAEQSGLRIDRGHELMEYFLHGKG